MEKTCDYNSCNGDKKKPGDYYSCNSDEKTCDYNSCNVVVAIKMRGGKIRQPSICGATSGEGGIKISLLMGVFFA